MIDWIKARWTGIICPLLGHKRIPLTQYQDGFFLWACERCGFFETGPEFLTILRRQRDHSAARGQDGRVDLFDELVRSVTEAS